MRARRRLLAALALASGFCLAASAAARGAAPPDQPSAAAAAAPSSGADSVRLAEIERTVDQLAALLEGPGRRADLAAPHRNGDRYRALQDRVAALARVERARWAGVPSISPVEGGTLTSPYTPTRLHPILREVQPHGGVDIAAPEGTPIRATADGTVRLATRLSTYGLLVDLDHGNGYVTSYGHVAEILVKEGQRVRRGEVIARVGSTGRSTGPHCHYEIYFEGLSVDPLPYLLDGSLAVE